MQKIKTKSRFISRLIVDAMYSLTKFKRYLCYPLNYCRHIVITGPMRSRSWIGDLG